LEIAGYNHDPTNHERKTDDYFPSVEEIVREEMSRRNTEDILQQLDGPNPDIIGSQLNSVQLRWDHGAGDSQGTRGMRIAPYDYNRLLTICRQPGDSR
jgi:hypothetical protein